MFKRKMHDCFNSGSSRPGIIIGRKLAINEMPKAKLLNNKKGILLIEVFLGVVIISVSLTMIIKSLMTSIRATVFSEDYTKASIILDNLFFDLMVAPDASLLSTYQEKDCDKPFEVYQCQVTSDSSLDGKGQEGLEKVQGISAAVSWSSGRNRKRISSGILAFETDN